MRELYIIDGYNFIFGYYKKEDPDNEQLRDLRDKLISELSQYKNYTGFEVIVVFDAKHSNRISSSREITENIEVIFSKSGETADTIVEKLVHNNEGFDRVFVVTSDYMQQKVVFKKNIYRKSIREFALEIKGFKKKLGQELKNIKQDAGRSFYMIGKRIDSQSRKKFDAIRKERSEG